MPCALTYTANFRNPTSATTVLFNTSLFGLIQYDLSMKNKDPDYLAGLLLEVIPRYSCLVFCPTKRNCESVCQLVCSLMPRYIYQQEQVQQALLHIILLHNLNTVEYSYYCYWVDLNNILSGFFV